MFDVGALELLVISVVALIVVGPERLPKLARAAGLWVGRARRAFASVKDEIDREIKAEELKEILRKQSESRPLDTILEETMNPRPTPRASGQTSSQAGGLNAGADNGLASEGLDASLKKAPETPKDRA